MHPYLFFASPFLPFSDRLFCSTLVSVLARASFSLSATLSSPSRKQRKTTRSPDSCHRSAHIRRTLGLTYGLNKQFFSIPLIFILYIHILEPQAQTYSIPTTRISPLILFRRPTKPTRVLFLFLMGRASHPWTASRFCDPLGTNTAFSLRRIMLRTLTLFVLPHSPLKLCSGFPSRLQLPILVRRLFSICPLLVL